MKVLVGITGGIAAYKVCAVVSALGQRSPSVQVVMTAAATEFVQPLTLATLARSPVYLDRDFWQPHHGKPLHITLAEWATVMLIAPLSANTLAKLSHGMADNLLTNVVLASRCPILLAPAMNTTMWEQTAVQDNWRKVLDNPRFHGIAPTAGVLACDAVGTGRMAEPELLEQYLWSLAWTGGKRDLANQTVLVSGGGTREFLDPVRFLGNPATGKQGVAIALAASHRGAAVTLVLANPDPALVRLARDQGIVVHPVSNAGALQDHMHGLFPAADYTVMAAAVGDVAPASYASVKLPKAELPQSLPLVPLPDIVAELGDRRRPDQTLIGFAAQTGTEADLRHRALDKLRTKKLNGIVANWVDGGDRGFGSDHNQGILFLDDSTEHPLPHGSKLELAHRLWDRVLTHQRP
ncbi:MAG: bifunctional phosphopantothenoylcysteine decarboxylase/phosphopantothenate--cysteine ligase CoaBC [Oscillatoriales cyanobacterium SM2_2_1]|nr:bifunctional phosphopantothenoylcysteine decarboxylase/phosphopantothenate--cysteine ligase CoaBC [Oscillatoriales cyanobacterium SM2_2_1]